MLWMTIILMYHTEGDDALCVHLRRQSAKGIFRCVAGASREPRDTLNAIKGNKLISRMAQINLVLRKMAKTSHTRIAYAYEPTLRCCSRSRIHFISLKRLKSRREKNEFTKNDDALCKPEEMFVNLRKLVCK